MKIEFTDIAPYRKQVKQLFITAFPREERPPMWMLTRRCHQGKARFSAVVDGGRFVGLTYVIGNEKVNKDKLILNVIFSTSNKYKYYKQERRTRNETFR